MWRGSDVLLGLKLATDSHVELPHRNGIDGF